MTTERPPGRRSECGQCSSTTQSLPKVWGYTLRFREEGRRGSGGQMVIQCRIQAGEG